VVFSMSSLPHGFIDAEHCCGGGGGGSIVLCFRPFKVSSSTLCILRMLSVLHHRIIDTCLML